MPRGYRCVILAAFGWLILAAGPSPNSSAQTEQAKSGNKVERSLEAIAGAQNKIAENPGPGEYQRPCRDGEYNNKSDLCAQWYAARAAKDAADWAYLSLVVGLVGAVGIVVALLLTRQSNRIARDTAKRQLRGYVGIVAPRVRPLKGSALSPNHNFCAKVSVKNYGQTPATIIESGLAVYFHDREIENPQKLVLKTEKGAAYLSPGQTIKMGYNTSVGAEALEKINAGETFFYFLARVVYVDAFGQETSLFLPARHIGKHFGKGLLGHTNMGETASETVRHRTWRARLSNLVSRTANDDDSHPDEG